LRGYLSIKKLSVKMVVFPNCKINLGLRILNKREDGYHNIETIFYPVPLKDALEIIPCDNITSTRFASSGLGINGYPENNLCVKAYRLLKKDFPTLAPVKIHLHKVIPTGAGLGGGSANAAFTLLLLDNLLGLNLSTNQLLDYALKLGSDCPFFIFNSPCVAMGRGETMEKIKLDLSGYQLMLVNPQIHINTAAAFSYLDMGKKYNPSTPVKEIVNQPINKWQQLLVNDFELPLFNKYPVMKEIKETLLKMGASYTAMSGSGSTVYGLFDKKLQPASAFDPGFFVRLVSL
jgi:4-diphosphocytidyl-2-C-methyl-D-erythritol kinase